jgi:hypothetical protein
MDTSPKSNYSVCGRCGADLVFDWTFRAWFAGSSAECRMYPEKLHHGPDLVPDALLRQRAS